MRASEIAGLCPGKTIIKGSALVTCCPCCQPNGPKSKGSGGHLHIEDKADGWAHLSCLLKCPEESILTALSLTQDDRRHENRATPETRRRIEAVAVKSGLALDEPKWTKYRPERVLQRYDYYKISGDYAFSKVRLQNPDDSKDFRCLIIDEPNLACCWSLSHLNGSADILYNYPRILQAIANGETIYINEGEKACDRMVEEGLAATCQRAGADPYAAKWLDIHTAMLAGAKELVIVADLDPASEQDHMNQVGQRYAASVCAKLKEARLRARVVTSKTNGDKDDGFDHFEAGYGVADFVARHDLEPAEDFQWANTIQEKEVDWLCYPTIPLGMLTGIEGQPGIGKGLLTCAIACAVSNGLKIGGFEDRFPKGKVLMLAFEDSAEYTIMKRLRKFGGDTTKIALNDKPFPFDHSGLERLDRMVESSGALLVTIDPLTSYLDPAVATKKITLREILATMKEISERHHCAIVCSRHLRKSSEDADPINAGYGGIEIVGAYRSALAARKDPDKIGHVVVSHFKSNVGLIGKSFGYQILPTETRGDFDFVWTGVRKESAEEMMTKGKPRQRGGEDAPIERALSFLTEVLSAGYVESTEIFKEAKQQGISQKTLYRAKDELGVKATKAGFSDGKWRWHKPSQESAPYNPYEDE